MQSLKTITSEYIESEDRFKLSALTNEDELLAFWMTQRLLTRLVTHLSKKIELGSPQSGGAPKGADASYSESDKDFETNCKHFPAESDVKIEKKFKPVLITEVDIKFGQCDLTLVLKSGNKSCASMFLSISELRQWLEILYTLWQRAGWPASLWPQKLNDYSSTKQVTINTIH